MFSCFAQNKIDAVLVHSPVNRFYETGFCASDGLLVLCEHGKVFYTDARYFEEAAARLKGYEVKCVSRDRLYPEVLQELKKAGAKTVGFEDGFLSVAAYYEFSQAFTDFDLTPASKFFASMRMVKSPEEIASITAAQRLTEKTLEKVKAAIRPGVTEKELKMQLVIECCRGGADGSAFPPIVAFGENTAVPHHESTDRKLEKSDPILLDFGVKLNGYCSDMTRTFCLNQPSAEYARLYEIVLSAQIYALKHIKAGMTCREADSLAREYIRANGYDAEFSHGLGHGVGLEIHEPPTVGERSEELLLPGTVVTVEPGVYIPGSYGVRIEDMVIVRGDGTENLTTADKGLVV